MKSDIDVATKYLFVDMAIKNLELDMQHVKDGPFKIKEPYVELIDEMILKARKEMRWIKNIMYRRKIEVLFMYTQGDFSTYKYILNGKEREMTFMNQVIKRNVE